MGMKMKIIKRAKVRPYTTVHCDWFTASYPPISCFLRVFITVTTLNAYQFA